MSDATSKLSRSTTNNSKTKKNSITSLHMNLKKNDFIEIDNPKDEYEEFISTKKEKNINLNKIQILKNRINNLKQQEQKNIRQIEILKEKEEKMKKIIKEKKENKKIIEDNKKKEHDKFILMKKKIQEDRQMQINNLNNSLMKRKENLYKKAKLVKNNKNEIKNKINKNNNTVLNVNKLKYEKAKTSIIFNKDKNMIIKAEKEEQKRRNRIELMNKEKLQNITLEKDIEMLEQEEEKYLDLIKQTQLLKQKLNKNSFHLNKNNKSFINKSIDIKDLQKINKKDTIRLQTNENYKNKILKINNDYPMRTFHKSIDASLTNDYSCDDKKQKLYINENVNTKNEKATIFNTINSKSCSNRNCKDNISFDKNFKNRDNSNKIYQRIKRPSLKQKIIDKILNIKINSNFEN